MHHCRALVALAVLAAAGGCSSTGGVECIAGLSDCDGECINTMADPTNCGSCGTECAVGERCEGGFCVGMCSSGMTECDGFCVDVRTNLDNCGSCGNACGMGERCEGGFCTGGGCDRGFTECGGRCVDVLVDPDHCGRCDDPCGAGEVCVEGACSSGGCTGGLTDCGGECVDLDKDAANCGSCGHGCGGEETCEGGECVGACTGGLASCGGECVNLATDRRHCGRCDNECGAGEVCDDGTCSAGGCTGGLTDCGGSCVDTATNPDHCGRCDNECPSGETCVGGECGVLCPDGQVECSGSCVTLETDARNCGRCGNACRSDQVCRGSCVCATGREECGGLCVDTRLDPENCGGCGTECVGSEACVDGDCTVSCPAGTEACSGYCVDVRSDRNNCGRCGVVCGASETCVGGACISGGGVPGDTCSSPIDVSGGGRFTGTTTGAGADYSGSCGGVTGPDVVFRYTLTEATDVYMSTFGTGFDTILYVRSGTCGSGTDMGCVDDFDRDSVFELQGELQFLDQAAGTYYVFLDGFGAASSGAYEFQIYFSEPSSRGGDACGEPVWMDIETATSVDSDTCPWYWIDYRDDTRGCGRGSGGLDVVYYFVVETAGTYTFETCDPGADWDTILDVRSVCDDPTTTGRVSCDDDGCGTQSRVTATLDPGVYYLWIDGYSATACGSYEIAITAP